LQPDYIITVYWAHLLRPVFYNSARYGTINFHPAFLPVNRGWHPHAHSIIDGTPTGVTLHAIEEDADTGPIWAQEKVNLLPTDTASDIYYRLQKEIVALFKETWPEIINRSISPKPQDDKFATYHKKSELSELDRIELDSICNPKKLINLLRARSFDDFGFAYFEENGKRVYLKLELGETPDFSEPKRN